MIDQQTRSTVFACVATYPSMVADAAGNRICLVNAIGFELSFDAEQSVILNVGEDAHGVADIFGLVTEDRGTLRVAFWNPDSTPEAVCANAIRCVPLLFPDRSTKPLIISTRCMQAEARTDGDFAEARLQLAAISVRQTAVDSFLIDAGTPHRVFLNRDLNAHVNFHADGERLAHGPNAVNVTWVAPVDGDVIDVRTYERGVGETKSCGTGAISAVLAHRAARAVGQVSSTVRFRSGQVLRVTLDTKGGQARVGGRYAVIARHHAALQTRNDRLVISL